ncbi:glycosyltransferase [Conexibacter sp. DBS9H8]|uniref:glycosyltransferase n=1 Tax=Conexibacter sp. DBS9H8 TaxID=2937801 RepID=UPI00200D9774|nr:glycosyltransferase [Conexibacter sp. DBS9H8]
MSSITTPSPRPDGPPRVTLGVATYTRDTFLEAAVTSALEQDFPSLEVLVVLDGGANPRTEAILARLGADPRLRIVRHPDNRGIAAAYNTIVDAAAGELIAMLGDDDVALPGRISRQVAIFDRHPDTAIVHGDATIIDATGATIGHWPSRELAPRQLLAALLFGHNHIVDPTRMVHRRVYAAIGGYDGRFPIANDFDLWLRAAPHFRFRHCPGGPLVAVRRHGGNASDETAGRAAEQADLEGILADALHRHDLRELCPELDWAVLEPATATRRALEQIAGRLERRAVPVPGLAARLRARAAALPAPPRPPRSPSRGRLMMTAFGWKDPGGGTTVPRLAAKALARRGWEVTVFHAATALTPSRVPYETVEWEEDGVRLIGVHNRPHGLFDMARPDRELDDPEITSRFSAALDRHRPDVVHFHNLHNLGAALIDAAAVRGLPAYFSTHNYWLICPRGYLMDGGGGICPGPGDGSRCARCTGVEDPRPHQRRLDGIRSRARLGLDRILAVSTAVRSTLVHAGYPAEMIDVVPQAMPHEQEIWQRVGSRRRPGRRGDQLTVAFLGSAYPHKGPQLLAAAAQLTRAPVRVKIIGETAPAMVEALAQIDTRGVVELCGPFTPAQLPELLADVDAAALPSLWWDCAPLAAAECRAAGLPLIVPRLGGLAEVVTDGVDGLVFTALDPASLAGALDRLTLEPGLLERLQRGIGPPASFDAYVDTLERYYRGERGDTDDRPEGPTVRWQGAFGAPTSLSIVNDQITERLTVALQRVQADGKSLDAPLPHTAAVEVRHQWPPDLSPAPAGALCVILPWEFGAVPRAWLEPIADHVDELWVPSEYVRRMYLDGGIAAERVQVIPNGVDLELFSPADATRPARAPTTDPSPPASAEPVRFLFVGGLIYRKGPDVLLAAWQRAFAGREDVVLVIKDFGADGIYRAGGPADPMRDPIRAHVSAGARARIELIDTELSPAELADLYRSCDVLVHPYRGEGFAMPVLEAMACGLPVICTAGGPTDEFCPPAAGWRIPARRAGFPAAQLGELVPEGTPWLLDPDVEALTRTLASVAADPAGRRARGAAARAAAEALSWDRVAARAEARIVALAQRSPGAAPARTRAGREPRPPGTDRSLRLLAVPAWRGRDDLAALLAAWAAATQTDGDAHLLLLADPDAAGDSAALEAHVLAAAARADVDLDRCADVHVLSRAARDLSGGSLHASVDALVVLHPASAGHVRAAQAAGTPVLGVNELPALLAGRRPRAEVPACR